MLLFIWAQFWSHFRIGNNSRRVKVILVFIASLGISSLVWTLHLLRQRPGGQAPLLRAEVLQGWKHSGCTRVLSASIDDHHHLASKGFLSSSISVKGDLHACEQTSLHAGHAVLDHEAVAGGGGGRLEPALGWVEIVSCTSWWCSFWSLTHCIVCEHDHSLSILSTKQQDAAMN